MNCRTCDSSGIQPVIDSFDASPTRIVDRGLIAQTVSRVMPPDLMTREISNLKGAVDALEQNMKNLNKTVSEHIEKTPNL
jgi:hypothetical protein